MNRAVLAVARWEILRFVKIKDLILGILFIGGTFAVYGLVGEFVGRQRDKPRDIAVLRADIMGLDRLESLDRFQLHPERRSLQELETAVKEGEYDALLVVITREQADLRRGTPAGRSQRYEHANFWRVRCAYAETAIGYQDYFY